MIVTENLETIPEKAPAAGNKKAAKQSPAAAKSNSWVVFFSLLLVTLAFVAIGGIGWKGLEFSQQLSQLDNQLQQSLSKHNEQTSQLSKMKQQVQQQDKQLQHNAERLAQLPGADRNDWLLAEAEYLLRLANQRLNLEKDWQGATAILTAADNVLAETQNPLLNPVRQILAQELQALRAVPAVDITGAVARLQAIQDQISELEWMPRTLPKMTAVVETPEESDEEPTAWQKLMTKAWAGLGIIVRVREHDKALPAPLTPDQHYYLQQNMHLMLEQAQVALVRQQDALYKQSIERTQTWLNEFVMVETAKSNGVKATLAELQQWNVSPEFPEISGSLTRLRQLLDQQRRNRGLPLSVSQAAAN